MSSSKAASEVTPRPSRRCGSAGRLMHTTIAMTLDGHGRGDAREATSIYRRLRGDIQHSRSGNLRRLGPDATLKGTRSDGHFPLFDEHDDVDEERWHEDGRAVAASVVMAAAAGIRAGRSQVREVRRPAADRGDRQEARRRSARTARARLGASAAAGPACRRAASVRARAASTSVQLTRSRMYEEHGQGDVCPRGASGVIDG